MKFLPIAFGVLIVLTRITSSYWPFVWPDEALFSSPAAELAAGRPFSTPVLSGLVPGMEKATLWNSPLYMLTLAGVYSFTGESLAAGRTLSLVLGCGVLVLFAAILRLTIQNRFLQGALLLFLAADPTFFRTANTIRMDVLTLLFFLAALYFLIRRETPEALGPARLRFALFAGIMTGFAALSHPAAILLIPILCIFLLPDWRHLVLAGATAALVLSTWLVYIIPNFDLFQIQFAAQLTRKGSMFSFWGGDTGGIFVVYLSQYGAGKWGMLLVAALTSSAAFLFAKRVLLGGLDKLTRKIGFSYGVALVMVLLMSEGWYAVYVGPLLLLTAGRLADGETEGAFRKSPGRILAIGAGIVFVISSCALMIQRSFLQGLPAAVRAYEDRIVKDVSACRSIYVRYRPDPYFLLRRDKPEIEVLEFIPGKLRIADPSSLRSRYDAVECFLVDGNGNWEPYLTQYLDAMAPLFETSRLDYEPLDHATLWVRRPLRSSTEAR